jgi:hypothetical protein
MIGEEGMKMKIKMRIKKPPGFSGPGGEGEQAVSDWLRCRG